MSTCCSELEKTKRQLMKLLIFNGDRNVNSKKEYEQQMKVKRIEAIANMLRTKHNFLKTAAKKASTTIVKSQNRYNANNFVKATGNLKKVYSLRNRS